MGTNTALPIWGYYMHKVYEDSTINISQGDFEKPLSLTGINVTDCSVEPETQIIDDFDVFDSGF